MTMMRIRDVSLNVEVVGQGYPILLMHGGLGLDHWSLRPFQQLAGQFSHLIKGWTVMDRLHESTFRPW